MRFAEQQKAEVKGKDNLKRGKQGISLKLGRRYSS
jgi:hypothetical protein